MRAPLTAATFLLVLFAPLAVAAADSYDDAFERARAAEARGDLAGAIEALTPALAAYPQDYDVALEIASLEARRGRTDEAARAYRVAIARSPRAAAARIGLATVLSRAGRCDEVDAEVRAAGASIAADSVPPCVRPASPPRAVVGLSFNQLLFPSHPYKSAASGATASVDVPIGAWSIGATGRYLSLSSRDESVMPAFTQQEGYLRAGVGNALVGGSLIFGVVRDGSGKLGTSEHVGTVLRWSPGGDLMLAATVSAYSDETIVRVSPSYRIPLGRGFSLTPALAVQRAEGATWWNGSLTLALDGERGGFFLGGKYGEEVRPAYLADSVVYDMTEHVTWGLWAGARVRFGEHFALRAAYSLDRLEGSSGTTPVSSNLHSFTVGPVFTF
jgi:hypothetical protein